MGTVSGSSGNTTLATTGRRGQIFNVAAGAAAAGAAATGPLTAAAAGAINTVRQLAGGEAGPYGPDGEVVLHNHQLEPTELEHDAPQHLPSLPRQTDPATGAEDAEIILHPQNKLQCPSGGRTLNPALSKTLGRRSLSKTFDPASDPSRALNPGLSKSLGRLSLSRISRSSRRLSSDVAQQQSATPAAGLTPLPDIELQHERGGGWGDSRAAAQVEDAHDGRDSRASSSEPSDEEAGKTGGGGRAAPAELDDILQPRPSTTGHYDPKHDVLMRLEYIKSREFKAAQLLLSLTAFVSFGALWAEFAIKESHTNKADRTILTSDASRIVNICVACICLGTLLPTAWLFFSRIWRSVRLKKYWTQRRKKVMQLYALELVNLLVNLIVWLAQNTYLLASRCRWFDAATHWLGFVQWTCWNNAFLVFIILAASANPDWKGGELPNGDQANGFDKPVWWHWPKLILWGTFEGFLIAATVHQEVSQTGSRNRPIPVGPDCREWVYTCTVSDFQLACSIILVVLVGVYGALFLYHLYVSWAFLRSQSYVKYRVANMALRLQGHTRLKVMAVFILSVVLLYFVSFDSCSSYAYSWLGLLPMFLVMTGLMITMGFLTMPNEPDENSPVLEVWLQEFAWSEEEVPQKLALRSSTRPDDDDLRQQPLFCFETGLKLFYWSNIVYDYKQVEDSKFSLEYGMRMTGCTEYELFWEKALDTKALLAWGKQTLVLAFRGTSSLSNVWADIQAWRSVHPPKRGRVFLGTRPLVHSGFLRSWQAAGLGEKIVARVREILAEPAADKQSFTIYVTGHSLGGALATLAAYDIAKATSELAGVRVACYTLGAPRTGNHAFAKDYIATVPDTWHIINDQDVVARGAKFLVLYKRPGQRVIINSMGDMLVRPNAVEVSVQLMGGGAKVGQHMLTSYWVSFVAVMAGQFSAKRLRGGMAGIIRLVSQIEGLRKKLAEHGLELEEMRHLAATGGSLPSMERHSKKGHCPLPSFMAELAQKYGTLPTRAAANAMAEAKDKKYRKAAHAELHGAFAHNTGEAVNGSHV